MTLYDIMPEPVVWVAEQMMKFIKYTVLIDLAIIYGPVLLAISLLGIVFIYKYIKRKKNSENDKSRK